MRLGPLNAWAVLAGASTVGALSSPVVDSATSESSTTSWTSIVSKIHETEVSCGKQIFGADSSVAATREYNDGDFIAYPLGKGSAGTDGTYLQNGDTIFESREPVVAVDECRAIIDEARTIIAQGLKQTDDETVETSDNAGFRTNSQLGEARLSQMPPERRKWLQETLQTSFFPLLEDRFGVGNLVLYDGLILGTRAPSRSQPIHRDACLLTLNIALSSLDGYDGGGTYIESLDRTLKINQGQLLCHAGGAMHAGVSISRGERWVLVLFVLAENQPQVARRCHAKALDYLQDQEKWDDAENLLQIGLSVAPNDHLLHNTMGRLNVMRGSLRAAFRSFEQADAAYPVCQKAMVGMAQVLIDQRRPRASLRRFDIALNRINGRDLLPDAMMSLKSLGWAARRDAARCAIICADHLHRRAKGQIDSAWCREHLPVAMERIRTCLDAAPNEPNLLGMRDHADFLLAQLGKE